MGMGYICCIIQTICRKITNQLALSPIIDMPFEVTWPGNFSLRARYA